MLSSTDLRSWNDMMSQQMSPMTVRSPELSDFHSSFYARSFLQTKILHVNGVAQELFRTNRQATQQQSPYYTIALQLDGRGSIHHNGRDAHVEPNDVVVFDWLKPHARDFSEDFEMVTMIVPQDSIFSEAGAIRSAAGHVIRGDSAAGNLIANLLRSLTSSLAHIDRQSGMITIRSIIDLTATALMQSTPVVESEAKATELYQQARVYIDELFSIPELNPTMLAQEMYVSVRTLHHVFRQNNTTVQSEIRTTRVRRAARELTSANRQTTSLSSLAHYCGFAGASQFSRTFRELTGLSPSEFRNSVQNGVQHLS